MSYRLSDSDRGAGRIYERLCRDFQRDNIFKDQASIKGGSSFGDVIEQAISDAQVMLVIMGPTWLTATGAAGAGIANPEDWVRREIELALKLDKPIIPVLLEGAKMPLLDQLPASLQALTERNGVAVDITNDRRFGNDMDDLVGRLEELIGASLTAKDSGICPYKGLEFFDWVGDDPNYFFGREKLVGELLERVLTANFMALVGASGNGKSSVLRAGLLYQLTLGERISGSDRWEILITRPEVHPMESLATAFVSNSGSRLDRAGELAQAMELLAKGAVGLQRLVQVSEAPRTVLVIDQFEEVFTRCDSPEEREQFFAVLMGALEKAGDKLCLIIAMRADFVGKCLEQAYGGLAEQVQQHLISVLPLTADELKDAICKPAEQAGLIVEPSLVTQILNDIEGAPGSLPLLQYTLKELWQRRQKSTLMLSAYQDLGGINGTLDKRATEIYNSFDDDQQRTVQHIFQQLTQLGEGTEDTRRRVFLDNLVSEPLHPAERVRTVIDRLSDKENRLLVTNEVVGKDEAKERRAIVDVAHEALIRHWRLLRQWIEKNRDLLRQQRRIEVAANEWQTRKHGSEYCLQGRQLSDARRFQKEYGHIFPLSQLGKSFVHQSVRNRRNNRLSFWGIAVLAPLAIAIYAGLQIRTSSRLQPSWDLVNAYDAVNNKISRNSLVRALEEINNANRSLARINLIFADLRYANLRSANLRYANLSDAYFSDAYLISANLSYANLSYANLSYANLSDANLSDANLSDANLISANLSSANLSDAYLRDTIFLATDLRTTKELTHQQLESETPPYICNSPLPKRIEIEGGKDRDCDKLADILYERYPSWFESPEAAAEFVKEKRQKTWE
ncbi:MAG: TIR domain-containing protein [Leptolyngbya sp. SIO3F4]|nr:TIR domain-containing protein [Leptolyngbya sp. SIO3F4]